MSLERRGGRQKPHLSLDASGISISPEDSPLHLISFIPQIDSTKPPHYSQVSDRPSAYRHSAHCTGTDRSEFLLFVQQSEEICFFVTSTHTRIFIQYKAMMTGLGRYNASIGLSMISIFFAPLLADIFSRNLSRYRGAFTQATQSTTAASAFITNFAFHATWHYTHLRLISTCSWESRSKTFPTGLRLPIHQRQLSWQLIGLQEQGLTSSAH